ncbi:hypothetical protein Sru01_40190 [Sphaerisporangium rufum]|uniref:ABC-2 type transport system permease protein n=1 Tax=Sphaerisporangium rufum TaxID=1381558 RepID=A0A919R3K0_9ACTN|nr:hypothetical protein [Sphaerisporangium rufum]GII79037.1 hypothetical protein Sru01_40190 [Sphaerisporangium rufum]
MAVELIMARMKIAVLRHSMTGRRAGFVAIGGILGAALAVGTIVLAVSAPALLPAAYAGWMLGWILGPVFAGGGDETLRPEYFTLVGLPPRRQATGLLVSAFVGVAPVVSLLALVGLVVEGARHGAGAALVALPAVALQLAVFVLLSKVAVAVLGIVLRSRLGAVPAGLINGTLLAALGQVWVFPVAFGANGGMPEFIRYLPSGWGVLAVQGEPGQAVTALAALALLVALLLAAWAALLTRRTTATNRSGGRPGRRPGRAADQAPRAGARPASDGSTGSTGSVGSAGPTDSGSPAGSAGSAGRTVPQSRAVLGKELRTWSRDLVRIHQLSFALAYGLAFAAAPLLVGWPGMLPWAGLIFIVMAAGMSANLYGSDGTALWLTIMTPGAEDVRGRQLAWLLIVGPPAVVLTVVLTAAVDGPWPMILTLLAALLGGGAGLVPLVSAYGLVPGIDPHRRSGNPLRATEDEGSATGQVYVVLALCALTAAPAGLIAWRYGWPGVIAGLVTGVLCAWGFGLLAQRRLTAQGPELLELLRTGRRPATKARPDLPRREQIISGVCWGFGAIPLFPQGVVPAITKLNGSGTRSWFLALYLPEWLQWPTIVFMISLGLAMYGAGLWIWLRHRRHPGLATAA